MTRHEADRIEAALAGPAATTRLRAAMAAGTHPDAALVGALVARCGVEPDFSVREALTWALVRHDSGQVLPLVVGELSSPVPQARSQALHVLSKVGDRTAWPAVTPGLLADPDDEVARAAWRAAVVLVPPDEASGLAELLAGQLARGDREVRRSLSRALVALGAAAAPALDRAAAHRDPAVAAHVVATERLARDPDAGFVDDVDEARRVSALHGAPVAPG